MKQFITKILFLLVLISPLAAQTAANLPGDVDGSGAVDIVDALKIARYVVGMVTALDYPENGDVDLNEEINIVDALIVAQYYVNIVKSLPVYPEPTPPPVPPVATRTVPYGAFTISFGETVIVERFSYTITFLDISDSRCAEGLVCVWEGEATAVFDLWLDSTHLGLMEVKAPPASPNRGTVMDSANFYGYHIDVDSIDPYPVVDVPFAKDNYTVNLTTVISLP